MLTFAASTLGVPTWELVGPIPVAEGQTMELSDTYEGATRNNPVSGAVHSILLNRDDANILILGTVNGGVWQSTKARALLHLRYAQKAA